MTHPELPHNLEAERAVIGAALVSRDALIRIAPWFSGEWFHLERHHEIWQVIIGLHQAGETPTIKSLIIALKRTERLESCGGLTYLIQLTDDAMSWQIEEYAREVERCAVLRQLIAAGAAVAKLGYQHDLAADEALGSAQKELARISCRSSVKSLVSFEELATRQYEWLNAGVAPGIPTGFCDLDELIGGLHASDLVIVAARPSVGKTALLLNLAMNIAKQGEHDAQIFSLEMSRDQLMQRAAATQAGIDLMALRMMRLGERDAERYMTALGTLAALPVFVDDTPAVPVSAIRNAAFRHQAERGQPLVLFVDYVQLMAAPGIKPDRRVEAVSAISRDLKALAKELDCPIVALSQLSRAVEGRQSKVPMLSDLRESGSLEQDADVVLFIYREELYDKETDNIGVAELHVAKHRNGPIGVVPMRFDKSTTRFQDLTYRTPEGY
jgi:replicative DNA helicase